jgi:hypothetical protein
MCPPLAVLQPAACAVARNAVRPCPAITSPTNIDDLSSAASTGQRVTVRHTHGGGVAHQIAAGRIRRPGKHQPLAESRQQVDERRNPRLVGIVDDEFAYPCLEQGDGDRAARAAGSDQKGRAPSG